MIGIPGPEVWRLLAEVALDGIHPGRRAVIGYLMDHPGVHATSTIAGHCKLTNTPRGATLRISLPTEWWI